MLEYCILVCRVLSSVVSQPQKKKIQNGLIFWMKGEFIALNEII